MGKIGENAIVWGPVLLVTGKLLPEKGKLRPLRLLALFAGAAGTIYGTTVSYKRRAKERA